jgi:hypothetical protein
MRSVQKKNLPLDKLRLDGDTQPRAAIDPEVVEDYRLAYALDQELPPLVVFFDGTEYWLADGFHRWHGARKADRDKIACEVHLGTLEEARWYSYAANQTHGLRRTNPDKRKAVEAALRHPCGVGMSDGQIAEHVGVSQAMVSKHRRELCATQKDFESAPRTGRDGRTINTANIGKGPRMEYVEPMEQAATRNGSRQAVQASSEPQDDPEPEEAPEPDPATKGSKGFPAAAREALRVLWEDWPQVGLDAFKRVLCDQADDLDREQEELGE